MLYIVQLKVFLKAQLLQFGKIPRNYLLQYSSERQNKDVIRLTSRS